MLRISWPLALVAAIAIAVVARRPRMLAPILIGIAVLAVWQAARRPRR
ncbi:MAG TPA: hypothetical protein VLU43_09385 [Anaeromyxobacteraceae bacterium]|nr:hypothetical protein [Anaeromyxobacteraceae bacterium]